MIYEYFFNISTIFYRLANIRNLFIKKILMKKLFFVISHPFGFGMTKHYYLSK